MKTNIKESIKIIGGILLGTGLVMFLIWFMAGGVMLMPPFIVIPILIVLFTVSFIVAGVMKGYKLAIVVVVSFVFGWFGFNAYYKHTCGPNSADVKVMKPMAEKISAYIVKHGIPESLKDIAGLPYGLVGCEHNTRKLKGEYGSHPYGVYLIESNELCLIAKKNIYIDYSSGYYPMDNEVAIVIRFRNKLTETVAFMDMEKNKNGDFVIKYPLQFASGKTTGICSPMKQ